MAAVVVSVLAVFTQEWQYAANPIDVSAPLVHQLIARPGIAWPRADAETADHFVIRTPLAESRRNHDCTIVRGRVLVNILGRFARHVEARGLQTGDVSLFPVRGRDPDGHALDDLNHIYGVRVASLEDVARGIDERMELWMPCGFHGDRVNHEISSTYARILDLRTMSLTLGPRLFQAGGACSALALALDGPGTPEHICAFGGTNGTHNKGSFLSTVACYDRLRRAWHQPFDNLPVGLDHFNAVLLPPGLCLPSDPGRILVMNFRIRHYADQRTEIWALDLPAPAEKAAAGGEPPPTTSRPTAHPPPHWYLFSNETGAAEYLQPRDASGVFTSGGGRYVFNVGGITYDTMPGRFGRTLHASAVRDDVRVLDVCARRWSATATSIGTGLFATQTCASAELGTAFTCGGQASDAQRGINESESMNKNSHACIAHNLRRGRSFSAGGGFGELSDRRH
jgi:hypothetical protein